MTVDPVIALAQRQRLEEAEKAEHALAQSVVGALGFNMPAPPHGYENFNHWAKRCGVRSLPAKPATVAYFALDLYRNGVSFEEIAQQLSAIGAVHDFSLLANPVRTEIVATALEAICPAEIKPPISWSKDARADWWELPTWCKAIIERREKQREKQLTRRLAELAAERKKLNEVQNENDKDNGAGNGAAEDTGDAGAGKETATVGAVA